MCGKRLLLDLGKECLRFVLAIQAFSRRDDGFCFTQACQIVLGQSKSCGLNGGHDIKMDRAAFAWHPGTEDVNGDWRLVHKVLVLWWLGQMKCVRLMCRLPHKHFAADRLA